MPVALDSFVPAPFVDVMVDTLKKCMPLPRECAVHPGRYEHIFCKECSKVGCDVCWR